MAGEGPVADPGLGPGEERRVDGASLLTALSNGPTDSLSLGLPLHHALASEIA
jgi:hypothetical protein